MNKRKVVVDRVLIVVVAVVSIATLGLTLMQWSGLSPLAIYDFFNEIEYVNGSVVYLDSGVYDVLSSRYAGDLDEFIYCVYGSSGEDYYLVKEIRETSYVSDGDSLSFSPCDKTGSYLGTLHSHPQPLDKKYMAVCELSKQDIFTFGKDGGVLEGVMCGTDKIAFFEKDNIDEPIGFEVLEAD